MSVFVSPPGRRGRDPFTKLLLVGDTLTDAALSTALGHPYAHSVLSLSSQYIQTPSAADLNFADEDFTLRGWFRFSSTGTQMLWDKWDQNNQREFYLWLYSGSLWFAWNSASGSASASVSWTPTVGTWYFIQCSRSSGYVSFYVNGVQIGASQVCSDTLYSTPGPLTIGKLYTDPVNYYFNGHIVDLEVAKGVAREPEVPSSPLVPDSHTSALFRLDASGAIVDASGTGKTWTPYNSPQAITGRTITNSGVTVVDATGLGLPSGFLDALNFNGSAALSTTDTADLRFLATDTWTIDFWVRPDVISGYQTVLAKWAGVAGDVALQYYADGGLRVLVHGSTLYTPSVNDTAGVPVHYALVGNGTNIKIYRNGSCDHTASSMDISNSAALYMGNINGGSSYFHGQIANLRITKGLARWTRDFTPPTRPY